MSGLERVAPSTSDWRVALLPIRRPVDNYSCDRYTCDRYMAPLTPAVVHVLLALAGGERHGYAILKDVQRQSASQLRFGPGTIYGTLQRLMEAGWVEEIAAPAAATDARRRYYRLTRDGR